MRPPRSVSLLLAAAALVQTGWLARAGATAGPPDAALIARVGERVAAYYQRVQRLICTERSTVVPIGSADSVQGSPVRWTQSCASRSTAKAEPRMTREVQRINGREPRERDKTHRSGCTDPTPLSPELLAFLLPDAARRLPVHRGPRRPRPRSRRLRHRLRVRAAHQPAGAHRGRVRTRRLLRLDGSGRGRRPPLGRRRDPRRAAARSSHHRSDRRARAVTSADASIASRAG